MLLLSQSNKLVNYNEGFISIPTVLFRNLVIVNKLLILMSLPVSYIYLTKGRVKIFYTLV